MNAGDDSVDKGITIREAGLDDAAAISRIRIDTWRTTYRGIVDDETLDGMDYEKGRLRWERSMKEQPSGHKWYVAEIAEGTIAGFAIGGKERSGLPGITSEIFAIYVLKEFQGRGIGRELVRAYVRDLLAGGDRSMLIWALEANPYRRFYERCGGMPVEKKMVTIGTRELIEIGYVWRDVSVLLEEID